MKKRTLSLLLSLCLCLLLLPAFTGCKAQSPYLAATSELSIAIFTAETEIYQITALSGKREDPYASDGVMAETYPFFNLTVKIKGEYSTGEEFGVSASICGESFAADLRFSALGDKLTASLPVKAPVEESSVSLSLYRGGESQTVTLMKKEDLCDYEEALSAAVRVLNSDLSPHLSRGKFLGEVHARLTTVQSVTYWFITFIPKDGETCSVLADGRSGDVLAVKGVTPSVTPSPSPSLG